MNKADLVELVLPKLAAGTSKVTATALINAVISSMSEAVIQSGELQLIGFGTFVVTQRAQRAAFNPATKQHCVIPAKRALRFKPGKELRAAVNPVPKAKGGKAGAKKKK